jgi:hypothetical protein
MSDPNQQSQPLDESPEASATESTSDRKSTFSRVLWIVLLMAGITLLLLAIAQMSRGLMQTNTRAIAVGAGLLAVGMVMFGWSFVRVDEMRIIYEPGETFASLKERPKFLVAGLLLLFLTIAVTVALFQRVDMERFIRDRMEQSSSSQQQTEAQKEMAVQIGKIVAAVVIPASVPFVVAGGAALYLLGVMAFGGTISYKKALAVWVFSSLPPALVATLIAVLVMFLKSPEELNPEKLLVTNPGAFMDPEASPALTALLGQFDLLSFYGLFLASIGLRKVANLSSGSAWGVVLGYWFIGTILVVSWKAITG